VKPRPASPFLILPLSAYELINYGFCAECFQSDVAERLWEYRKPIRLQKRRPQAGFLIVQNNPIPFENPADSLAIAGVSSVPLSDGVQHHSTSSDDEVGGQVGGQRDSEGKSMGKLNPKQVENLTEPGTYEDGDGLRLVVNVAADRKLTQ
jgi:hypothetical protein